MKLSDLRLYDARILNAVGRCELYLGDCPLFENALLLGRAVRVVAHLPRRLGTTALFCVLITDNREVMRARMRYCGMQKGADMYEGELCPGYAGLFFFSFHGESPSGPFYGNRAAFGREISFSRMESGAHFQLTVSDFLYSAPRWLYGGIIYHIFVDRFRRAGSPPVREDAILNPDWENGIPAYPAYRGAPLENNEFFGGTLDGITEKLGELAELGVNCLYLSPVFEAYSNHKYDTGDYERIDRMFGGEEAFKRLLRAARKRGIRLVLDGVFNHTGSDSVYFNKKGRYQTIGAYQSKDSPYYDWYSFSNHPDCYESWWGIDTLPRVSPSVPSLRNFFVGVGGIVDRYAAAGIGGFRLDVVDELTDDFVEDIKACLARRVPDGVLFGEVWEDASHKVSYGVRRRYYSGKELDGVMNYPLREGLVSYFRDGETHMLRRALCEVLPNMPPRIAAATMNLLGTHDTVRILTALAGEAEAGRDAEELARLHLSPAAYRHGRSLLILAYLVLSTLPGIPSIFYGDEVGMEGYADPLNRRPYPWHRRDRHLLSAYRAIGKMRRKETVFREGDFRLLYLDHSHLVFVRSRGRRAVLTVVNRSAFGLWVRFDRPTECLFGSHPMGNRFLIKAKSGAVFRTLRGCGLRLSGDDGEPLFFS